MKSVCTLLLGLAFAASAVAQDQDKDALKKELLKEVEKRLRSEDERLLKDIEKLIDEELKGGGKAAPKVAPKPEPKVEPKVEPKAEPKAEAPKRKGRGYLGVRLIELTDEDKKDLGVKGGLKIGEAIAGGPAAKAGLQVDDVILTLDGRAVDSAQELAPIMQGAGAGASMKVEYLRDGKKKNATVVLGAHPGDAPAPQAEPPKDQGKQEEDLRERVKKFLQKKDAPPQQEPKPKGKPAPDDGSGGLDDLFAVDEDTFEQFREMFEKFGVDPEQFFEKGKDGKYRLNDQMKEMFKNFNFKEFLPKGVPGLPGDEPPPAKPKKAEPRVEPKKAEPRAPRPWMGISPEDLPDELRAQLDLPEGEGLLITEVVAGGPAEKAGLKKNDILIKIDGKAVKGEESLAKFMGTAKAGQEVTLTVLRKSKEQTIKVTVGEK